MEGRGQCGGGAWEEGLCPAPLTEFMNNWESMHWGVPYMPRLLKAFLCLPCIVSWILCSLLLKYSNMWEQPGVLPIFALWALSRKPGMLFMWSVYPWRLWQKDVMLLSNTSVYICLWVLNFQTGHVTFYLGYEFRSQQNGYENLCYFSLIYLLMLHCTWFLKLGNYR